MADDVRWIKVVKVHDQNYEIGAKSATSALSAEYATSALSAGFAENVPASAISSIPWSAVSGLTGSISTATTTGIAEPRAVAQAIAENIAGVYKVKGCSAWTAITADADAKQNGNVFNITAIPDTGASGVHNEPIYVGDNVVYLSAENGFDKLASTTDLSQYKTWNETSAYINSSESGSFTALWNQTTAYINSGVNSANGATALWNNVTDYVNSVIDSSISAITGTDGSATLWNSNYETTTANSANWNSAYNAWNERIVSADDFEKAGNEDKLATVSAISSYVTTKITSASVTAVSAIKSDTVATAIPNVQAVSSYCYESVSYDSNTSSLIIDFTPKSSS